jgi:hypothetical protein
MIKTLNNSNAREIITRTGIVLMSYSTIVAVICPDLQSFKTDTRYSSTTTKHINSFFKQHGILADSVRLLPQDILDRCLVLDLPEA